MRAAAAAMLAGLAVSAATAADSGGHPALEGFTGQLTTPSAWTIAPGTAHLLFTDSEDPRFRERGTTRTYALTLGLLRYAELSGRLTELRPQPALRDLSFNVKLQAPLDLVAPRLPIALAVGGQDEGGAATNFATRYAVASVRLWRVTASVGWGRGPDRMKGVFGGGTLEVVDWLEVVGDWDGADLNAGLRASVPLDAVGLPFRLGAIAKSAVRHEPRAIEWGATLEVPLWLNAGPGGRRLVRDGAPPRPPSAAAPPTSPALEVRTTSAEDASARTSPDSTEPARDLAADDGADPLLELEEALVEIGFEEVRAGRSGEVIVVEYENGVFNHDEADALSVVLRRIELAGLASRPLAVVVKRNGLRVAEISVPGAAEAASPAPRSGPDPRWRYGPSPRRVRWVSQAPRNRSALHTRLVLAPGLDTFVGTEVGALDWLVSFRPDVIVPLWPGATAFARADIPVTWSDDLRERGTFRRYRHDSRLEYALVHQAVPLAPGLMAMVGGGVVRATDAGGLGEVLWSTFDGALALGVQGSWTANDRMEERRAATGSARVGIAPLDLSAVVRAGRFVNGDRGATVELSRWFGDTQVGVFFTRTEVAIAGAFLTIPLTPRKDMRPGWLQIRGSRRWGHGIGTVVGEGTNAITTGLGVAPVAPWNLESSYLDWGRISRDGLVEPVRALPALSR
jgi:hypothetical protein